MPEYVVKFMGAVKAKDRKEAWQKAMILVRECNLTVISVSTEPLKVKLLGKGAKK